MLRAKVVEVHLVVNLHGRYELRQDEGRQDRISTFWPDYWLIDESGVPAGRQLFSSGSSLFCLYLAETLREEGYGYAIYGLVLARSKSVENAFSRVGCFENFPGSGEESRVCGGEQVQEVCII